MLRLCGCDIGHRPKILVRGASLSVEPGKIKGLVAPNGFGKSTLMHVASGEFSYLQKGHVEVDGIVFNDSFTSPDILYVPGDASHLYGHLSALDHLKIAQRAWQTSESLDACIARSGINDYSRKRVKGLSSGMKQQVALAIALLVRPKYLLLDEPTNALDPINAAQAVEAIRQMARDGVGILVSSHLLGTIDALCSSILFIRSGTLVEVPADGDVSSMFSICYGDHACVQG